MRLRASVPWTGAALAESPLAASQECHVAFITGFLCRHSEGSVRRRSPRTDRTSPGGESASGSRVREPARWHREKEGRSGTLFGTRSRSTWVCWASCGVWGSCSPRPTPARGDGPGTSRDTHEGLSRLARTRSGTGAGSCHRALAVRGLPRLGWRGVPLREGAVRAERAEDAARTQARARQVTHCAGGG